MSSILSAFDVRFLHVGIAHTTSSGTLFMLGSACSHNLEELVVYDNGWSVTSVDPIQAVLQCRKLARFIILFRNPKEGTKQKQAHEQVIDGRMGDFASLTLRPEYYHWMTGAMDEDYPSIRMAAVFCCLVGDRFSNRPKPFGWVYDYMLNWFIEKNHSYHCPLRFLLLCVSLVLVLNGKRR